MATLFAFVSLGDPEHFENWLAILALAELVYIGVVATGEHRW